MVPTFFDSRRKREHLEHSGRFQIGYFSILSLFSYRAIVCRQVEWERRSFQIEASYEGTIFVDLLRGTGQVGV